MLNLSLIIFRRANLNWYKPIFYAPFYPWLSLIGIALSLFVLTMMNNSSKIIGFSIILGSIILYYAYGRERTNVKGLIGKLIKEDKEFKRIKEVIKNISLSICNYNSVVKGILAEAKIGKYDLIIIGASEEWKLKNFLFGSIPDYIANKALCSVLMVKKHEAPYISWIKKMRDLVFKK